MKVLIGSPDTPGETVPALPREALACKLNGAHAVVDLAHLAKAERLAAGEYEGICW